MYHWKVLLILKQGAEEDRESSVKGQKDRIDILTLLLIGMDYSVYSSLLKKHKKIHYYERLKKIITDFREPQYLNLTPREWKLRKKEILQSLKQ